VRRTPIVALACVLSLGACTSKPKPQASTTPRATTTRSPHPTQAIPAGDWPAYHHDAARSGISTDQGPLGKVRRAWESPHLDANVYAEPLIAAGHVIVATEADSVYSLNPSTGAVEWRRSLGTAVNGGSLPCGNIDPTGVTGTPVIDIASSTIYVVAFLRDGPHHQLFALDLKSGRIRWQRRIDAPRLSPVVEQQRGALAFGNGRVYVTFGGLQGDCGPYKGAIVAAPASGRGALSSYVVPTTREGGMWQPGGPVIDSTGDVWVVTGNTASTGSFDFGNAVIRLSPTLHVRDYFAPSSWRFLNTADADLGSVAPGLLANGRVFAAGKTGIAYLLNRASLGHVGGEVSAQHVCSRAFGTTATQGSMVFLPCENSLVGLRVSTRSIHVVWRLDGKSGPPIVAAGSVWSLNSGGRLVALSPATGHERFRTSIGAPVSRFISMAAAGGKLMIAEGDRILAFAFR
jgi:outer membrane protein assembly factor BamB